VVTDSLKAQSIVAFRQLKLREKAMAASSKIKLEDLSRAIAEGQLKELPLVVKADVQGSVEAVSDQLMKIPQEKIKLVINATNEASNVQPNEVKRMLGREVFWSIPYDRAISTATQMGMPVVVAKPTCRASESMVEMAHALSGVKQGHAQKPKESAQKSGLLSRFLGAPEEKHEVGVE
jgi:MinD-like ATPase involved in chromosome partitioning or flagellar assembly